MSLHHLLFDASDDGQGTGSWEAMATVRAERLQRVMVEVEAALAAAAQDAPGPRGPLDEGGAWDAELQVQHEGEWVTVTLTLTGPWAWGEALVAGFSAGG